MEAREQPKSPEEAAEYGIQRRGGGITVAGGGHCWAPKS